MMIPLDKNLRLVGKDLAWELQKRRKKNGVLSWQAYKYYRRLSHALSEVGERRVRLMPGDSMSDALEAMDTVRRDLRKILDLASLENEDRTNPSKRNKNAAISVESPDAGQRQ